MTFDFTSFPTVFQSYQDDPGVVVKGNGTSITVLKSFSPQVGLEPGTLDH